MVFKQFIALSGMPGLINLKLQKKTQMKARYTRGEGLLESFLARARSHKANELIPLELRKGRILDIGCGSYPYFLSNTYFKEKFAIEQQSNSLEFPDITWYEMDLNSNPVVPFSNNYFSAITMLAVIEHLDPNSLVMLFSEVYRTLSPGGALVLTTPASWTDWLLRWMAKYNLVSPQEIDEHKYAYTLPLLGWYFGRAGFSLEKVEFGYFEFGMNLWGLAYK